MDGGRDGLDWGPLVLRQKVKILKQQSSCNLFALVCITLAKTLTEKKKGLIKGILDRFNKIDSYKIRKNNDRS